MDEKPTKRLTFLIMKELKIIQAKAYINMMGARTNREEHREQLDNAYNQIQYLENWRQKAIILINAAQINNRNIKNKAIQDDSKRFKLENDILTLEQENERLKTQVNNLTKHLEL